MTVRPLACQPVAAARNWAHLRGMADKEKERTERLAAALRENLKRRKQQARAASKLREKDGEDR